MLFTMEGSTRSAERSPAAGFSGRVVAPLRLRHARTRSGAVAPVALRDRRRRILNLFVALIGLILAAPLMLIVAILVKITSRGPVLFAQTRVGIDRRQLGVDMGNGRRQVDHGGRLFRIYKFRTMSVEGEIRQVWAAPDDPRVTPVGRVLRKFRLDELPQLINVLKGDMNIVGPRPEQPAIFAVLRERVDHYRHRQQVLPGITGWAQINHHYDMSIEDVQHKLHYDLEYVGRRSLWEDAKIMLRTLPVVIFRKGAW